MREAWEAREAEAAVDEARRETSPLELRKDRDVIANLSQLVKKYFGNVKGLRVETDNSMYPGCTGGVGAKHRNKGSYKR